MDIPLSVDRKAAEPLYRQLSNQLREWIESSAPQPGTQLPSESEFVEALGVARMTVRQALKELCATGLVEAQRGRGVFVVRTPWFNSQNTVLQFASILVSAEVLRDREDVLYFFEKPWKWDREWQIWHSHDEPEPPDYTDRRSLKSAVAQWESLLDAFEQIPDSDPTD